MKAIQQKWKHDKQRQNEELMKFYKENKINPAVVVPADRAPDPDLHLALLRPAPLRRATCCRIYGGSVEWLDLVDITEPVKDGWGPLLLVIYVASQLSSSYFMSSTMQGAQRVLLMVLPVVFVPFILNFPAGLMLYWLTTNLWTTGPGHRHPAADAEARAAREAQLADAGEGRAGRQPSGQRKPAAAKPTARQRRPQARRRPAAPREAQAGRREAPSDDDEITVEATGETVGEAKWARRAGARAAASRASTATRCASRS